MRFLVRAIAIAFLFPFFPAVLIAQEAPEAFTPPSMSSRLTQAPPPDTEKALRAPQGASTQRRIFVRSDTVYMNSDTIRQALLKQPEFARLNLALSDNRGQCDLFLEIRRPVFTWDWQFILVEAKTGREVAKQKVTAATAQHAARGIAPLVMKALAQDTKMEEPSPPAPAKPKVVVQIPAQEARPGITSVTLRQKLQSAKVIQVRSETVWFHASDLEGALKARPEFAGWGYKLVTAGDAPHDLRIVINRPAFTFDWVYTILDPTTRNRLARGKVTAWDGPHAAPQLAKHVVSSIAAVRGLPEQLQTKQSEAMAEVDVRAWQVRLVSGQRGLGKDDKITLVAGSRTLSGRRGGAILFSVPGKDLVYMGRTTQLTNRGGKWSGFWAETMDSLGASDGGEGIGGLVIMLSMAGIAAGGGRILKASEGTQHFLIMHWKEGAGLATATLQVTEKQSAEICAELERLAKLRATDIDAESERLRADLRREYASGHVVELDRRVAVGFATLSPGQYNLVILDRGAGRADVYFLKGKFTDLDDVAARAPVEVLPREDSSTDTKVLYVTSFGRETLEEIQLAEHSLRFRGVPILSDPVD